MNDVTLEAMAGGIEDANGAAMNVTADDLTATAATGIDLDTRVNSLTAVTTGAGSINIDQTDAVILTNVTAANGAIRVYSGGAMDARQVVSATSTGVNDIDLQGGGGGGGDLVVGRIMAGPQGAVKLKAGGALKDGNGIAENIIARSFTGSAKTGIDLDTRVRTLTATTTGGGDIAIDETNAVTLTNVTAANGAVRVYSGGGMDARKAVSTTSADANDIDLRALAGDLKVGTVTAGGTTPQGDVNLRATAGEITDGNGAALNVTADSLTAAAKSGIALGTRVRTLTATTTGPGNIAIDETNAITLTKVAATNGAIRVYSGGAMNAQSVVCKTDANANDIDLKAAAGNLTVGIVKTVGGMWGDARLEATVGKITDGNGVTLNVTADELVLTAGKGIGSAADPLDTNVNSLWADGGTGGVYINNTGGLVIETVGGPTDVMCAGGIEISLTNGVVADAGVRDTGTGLPH